MVERFAFENEFKPNVKEVGVHLTPEQHVQIQDALVDIASDLDKHAVPTLRRDHVRFIPKPALDAVVNKNPRGFGTIVDLSIDSKRQYFEDSSEDTFGLKADFISSRLPNTPIETISTSSVIGSILAYAVNLKTQDNLMKLESGMTFSELTQSLYELTGISNIRELGNPDNEYQFKDANRFLFEILTSKNYDEQIAISAITREKTYNNEDPTLSMMPNSPLMYESDLGVSLESRYHIYPTDEKNPAIHYIGLTCLGMFNLFDDGKIYQEMKYSFFKGTTSIPTVKVSLKSEDFTTEQLKSKLKTVTKDFDPVTTTTSAVEILSQLTSTSDV